MKIKELSALNDIVTLKYRHQQKAFQKILAAETILRSEYKRLDHESKVAMEQTNSSMRGIGADVLWQAWLDRSKARVNMELTQVLIQKEHYFYRVREEFGKVEVVRELEKAAKTNNIASRNQKQLHQAIDGMLNCRLATSKTSKLR